MTALTQAVAIGDNELRIDTALAAGQVPGFVQIDDELLSVGGQNNTTGLILSLSSPAREAHDNGATVTYAGRPYDPTFKMALAGGEQTIRLLGPFHIAHDTPGITDDYTSLGETLAADAQIVRFTVYPTQSWEAGTLEIAVGPGPTVIFTAVGAIQATTGTGGIIYDIRNLVNAPTVTEAFPLLGSGGLLSVGFWPDAELTQGEADIYVLIAEPAA